MKLNELLDIVKKVQEAYNTSTPYICGGTPRDKYMKRLDNIDDLDFTTGDKTIKVVSVGLRDYLRNNYRIAYKQMDDGHSSIYMGNLKLDFSSNYMNPNIDKELLSIGISNPTSLQKEMYSRDFTCNSLLLDLNLTTIFSPVNGAKKDIDNKIIKTCLPPEITLMNSKNRVVRAIYLSSKLDFEIDVNIINFVRAHPESLNVSVPDTVKSKLDKAFEYNPEKAVKNITAMNLWKYVPITDIMTPYYRKLIEVNKWAK